MCAEVCSWRVHRADLDHRLQQEVPVVVFRVCLQRVGIEDRTWMEGCWLDKERNQVS